MVASALVAPQIKLRHSLLSESYLFARKVPHDWGGTHAAKFQSGRPQEFAALTVRARGALPATDAWP
jgi:hypothetical protein